MDLLKRENWYFWILLFLIPGVDTFVLGGILDVYEEDAWYNKWYYWTLGAIFLFFPLMVMVAAFFVQIAIKNAQKLKVPGEEIYACPYFWILCLILPIIGIIFFFTALLYIKIDTIIQLKHGNGEVYLK